MLPLVLALAALAAKQGADAYTGLRSQRANRRLQHRQDENEETQKHDARRAAIMNDLGVNAPMQRHQLQDQGHGTDLSGENTVSGLLGFGSNMAALYAAQAGPQGPTDVPMPYQGKKYPSAYGPGSTIKPGTPYR